MTKESAVVEAETRSCGSPRVIPTATIAKAVEKEFDRTLPFWRCYASLRTDDESGGMCLRRPAVFSRETRVVFRVPCTVFKGVDVIWASTHVVLRVPLQKQEGRRYAHNDPDISFSRYWHDVPFKEGQYTLDTMHFVHHDAHRKRSRGGEHSFHIQSVVLRDDPSILQCVAGTMVNFAFLVYVMLRVVAAASCQKERDCSTRDAASNRSMTEISKTAHDKIEVCTVKTVAKQYLSSADAADRLRDYCPPRDATIVILGMGGNSMALSLRAVLGPDAIIHVVEMEVAVIEVCRLAGTLDAGGETDPNMRVHLQEASAFLRSTEGAALSDRADMVFMDLFEPINAKMDSSELLVHLCAGTLRPGGLLVVNDHQLPSQKSLSPLARIFGPANVQAVNLHGWNESVIVSVKPGNPLTDGLSAQCLLKTLSSAYGILDTVRPGWLPHPSWLQKTHCPSSMKGCRVWVS